MWLGQENCREKVHIDEGRETVSFIQSPDPECMKPAHSGASQGGTFHPLTSSSSSHRSSFNTMGHSQMHWVSLRRVGRQARGAGGELMTSPFFFRRASYQGQGLNGGARGKGAWSFTFLKMFALAVSDQKNHRDSLNFQGPGRSGGQKLFLCLYFLATVLFNKSIKICPPVFLTCEDWNTYYSWWFLPK